MAYSRNKPNPIISNIILAVFGFIAIIGGWLIDVTAFNMVFFPSPTDTLTVNNVPIHPGNPNFIPTAEGLLLLGVILTIGGFASAGVAIYKIYSSGRAQSEHREIELESEQEDDYSDANNLIESLPSFDDSNESSIKNTLTDYSDSSNDFDKSISSTSQSLVSNASCPFCGAIIKPNEEFCNNCGKRF